MAPPPQRFVTLVTEITSELRGRPVEPGLKALLDAKFPPGGRVFDALEALCHEGLAAGWLCAREADGVRFGRPVKPGPLTHGFSVDVVLMDNIVGPHHSHPAGEIDMVLPIDESAEFDGVGRGWLVYGAGSAHRPTVRSGKALVLYLLPEGAIEFTGQ